MAPSVSAYIESVLNSAERFRSLSYIYPVTNPVGELRFTTDEKGVTFIMEWNKVRYYMYCPFSLTADESMRLVEACTETSISRNPYITPVTYRKNELLVFVTDIQTEWKDVLLQEYPEGKKLADYVRINLLSPDRGPFRRLLNGLLRMGESFAEGGIVHGALSPYNIYVKGDGMPVTLNYRLSRSCNPVADCLAVARMAALIYLFGCNGHLWNLFGQKNSFTSPIPIRLLRNVVDQADYAGIPSLSNLIHAIADISSHDMRSICRLVEKLYYEPFRRVGNLEEMLIMETEVESRRARRLWRLPLPTAPAPSPASDNTLKIDFEKCTWVGALQDTVIRFEYKNRFGYADRFGWRITNRMFLSAGDFYEGRARVQVEDGQYGLIDRYGDFVMEPLYEDLVWYGEYNVVTALSDGKWHIYDRRGRRLTLAGYDWMGECSEGFIPARRGFNYGFLRTDGEQLSDFRYDETFAFRDGRALVVYNGRRYYINNQGNKIISKVSDVSGFGDEYVSSDDAGGAFPVSESPDTYECPSSL